MSTLHPDVRFGELLLRGDRPFLIAEAGVNHESDLSRALRMVREAASAGADAIKFQSYKADTLASRDSPAYWDLKSEPTTSQHALFSKYDAFGDEEYAELAAEASRAGIVFMSTPFDDHFVDSLEPLMPVYKLASADLTNIPLLERIARKGKPVILSTGASTMDEIEVAILLVRSHTDAPVALLHCVLSYPCSPADANLLVIESLRRRFPDVVVGYSDHVPPSESFRELTTAWLLGARILEKHFTLDKTLPGNDHYHAMDPEDIRAFRHECDQMNALLGESERRVFACEESARRQARRSLVSAQPIAAGTRVSPEMLIAKRPGTGIAPGDRDRLVGRIALSDIPEDQVLRWEMFAE